MDMRKYLILLGFAVVTINVRAASPTLAGTNAYTGNNSYSSSNQIFTAGFQVSPGFWLNGVWITNIVSSTNNNYYTNNFYYTNTTYVTNNYTVDYTQVLLKNLSWGSATNIPLLTYSNSTGSNLVFQSIYWAYDSAETPVEVSPAISVTLQRKLYLTQSSYTVPSGGTPYPTLVFVPTNTVFTAYLSSSYYASPTTINGFFGYKVIMQYTP